MKTICTGKDHVEERLEYILSQGGEGVMLKKAQPEYAHGRSKNLLKVKKFHDAEAIVLEHEPGKGRNKGRMGALKCKMTGSSDKIFNIGTGFTDSERENPPPVGSTVTYQYQELTNGGIPRFPTYLRVRPVELEAGALWAEQQAAEALSLARHLYHIDHTKALHH
jgi:DNA ligase 1